MLFTTHLCSHIRARFTPKCITQIYTAFLPSLILLQHALKSIDGLHWKIGNHSKLARTNNERVFQDSRVWNVKMFEREAALKCCPDNSVAISHATLQRRSKNIVTSNSWQEIHLPATTQERNRARRKNLLFDGPTWVSFIRSVHVWFIDASRCVLNERPIRWTTFWPLSKRGCKMPVICVAIPWL